VTFSAAEEARLRAAGRLWAEEFLSLQRPSASLQADEAGPVVGTRRVEIDLSTADTVDLGGPWYGVHVLKGDSGATIELMGFDEAPPIDTIEAYTGLTIPARARRVRVVVPTSTEGTMILLLSELPGQVPTRGVDVWEPFQSEVTGAAGNVETSITLPPGYDYRLKGLRIRVVCDSTVATRVMRAYLLDQAGVRVRHFVQATGGPGADETGVLELVPGAVGERNDVGVSGLMATGAGPVNEHDVIGVPHWSARITAAPTNAGHFFTAISSGVAGDTVEMVAALERRSL